MEAVLSEFVVYLIKFICMLLFAAGGISVGKLLRKKKNIKLAEEKNQQ